MIDELEAWLNQIWTEDEARLTHPTFCGPVWPTTDQMLSRIAAERWTIHHVVRDVLPMVPDQGTYDAFVEVIKHLAVGYAYRPGYCEEWRPEVDEAKTPDQPSPLTMVEFLRDRVESDRGQAQYTLNQMESGGPMMLMPGSVRSTIVASCNRVIADATTKLAIIDDVPGYDGRDQWATTVHRMAADYSDHTDYEGLEPA